MYKKSAQLFQNRTLAKGWETHLFFGAGSEQLARHGGLVWRQEAAEVRLHAWLPGQAAEVIVHEKRGAQVGHVLQHGGVLRNLVGGRGDLGTTEYIRRSLGVVLLRCGQAGSLKTRKQLFSLGSAGNL